MGGLGEWGCRVLPLAATMLETRTSFSLDDSFRVSPRRTAVLTMVLRCLWMDGWVGGVVWWSKSWAGPKNIGRKAPKCCCSMGDEEALSVAGLLRA